MAMKGDHRDILTRLECDIGQGYYFMKPVSAQVIHTLFHEGLKT
ncbi:Uncharacterised protein [Legionella waltersii]|nr:Uncharacterised protein [Legionella waltersii]